MIYRPLTSRPFLSNRLYKEYRPCVRLEPYVSCYWMMEEEGKMAEEENAGAGIPIIPDTCVDVIVRVNHTKQKVTGYLCGLQDRPFSSTGRGQKDVVTSFAVRFYFWSAGLFFRLNWKEASNGQLELEALGKEWERLFAPFLSMTDMAERIAAVEAFLLKKLEEAAGNPALLNAVHQMLVSSGRTAVKEVCEYCCVSQRQMERLFLREVGLPLKRIAGLIRYQNVWRDLVTAERFDIHGAVYRYGYTDQAHLLKEFKKFHGMTPEEARAFALLNR